MSTEKILDKVKKLLALATNEAATEGERENALRMAHNLLAAHNLAMSDLHEYEKQESREQMTVETFQMGWCCQLANATAKLFFCIYIQGEKLNATKGKHYFIGKESNVVTASYMTEYLISSILKECRKRFKHNLAPESRSFAIGATNALLAKMRTMRESNTAPSMGTGIVLYNIYQLEEKENEEFLAGLGIKTKSVVTRQAKVGIEYHDGKRYGNSLNINEQVTTSKKAKQLT